MATPTHNYVWPQGEDLVVSLVYKEGPEGSEVPINLTGYTVRMDIVHPTTGAAIFTFNTIEQTDPDEVVVGTDGSINITVPRTLTLPPDGDVYELMPGVTVFNYDVFLRNPSGKQKKLLRGTVTIEPSYTLWS